MSYKKVPMYAHPTSSINSERNTDDPGDMSDSQVPPPLPPVPAHAHAPAPTRPSSDPSSSYREEVGGVGDQLAPSLGMAVPFMDTNAAYNNFVGTLSFGLLSNTNNGSHGKETKNESFSESSIDARENLLMQRLDNLQKESDELRREIEELKKIKVDAAIKESEREKVTQALSSSQLNTNKHTLAPGILPLALPPPPAPPAPSPSSSSTSNPNTTTFPKSSQQQQIQSLAATSKKPPPAWARK